MAPILTTERATGRRSRIAMRRAPRPMCARGVSAQSAAPMSGPLALAPASPPVAGAHASPVRVGAVQPVHARTGARRASVATFRRRRLLALVGLIGALVIVGQAGAALGGPSLAPASPPPAVHRYVVRAGDSLWGAASHLAPDEDPRAVVDALVDARGNGPLMLGEVLRWQG